LLQHQSQINGDNLNNVRCEVSRHFRNKKKAHLRDKINELATGSKNKNIRGVNAFRGATNPEVTYRRICGWDGEIMRTTAPSYCIVIKPHSLYLFKGKQA
jgi:hypothetical protein